MAPTTSYVSTWKRRPWAWRRTDPAASNMPNAPCQSSIFWAATVPRRTNGITKSITLPTKYPCLCIQSNWQHQTTCSIKRNTIPITTMTYPTHMRKWSYEIIYMKPPSPFYNRSQCGIRSLFIKSCLTQAFEYKGCLRWLIGYFSLRRCLTMSSFFICFFIKAKWRKRFGTHDEWMNLEWYDEWLNF